MYVATFLDTWKIGIAVECEADRERELTGRLQHHCLADYLSTNHLATAIWLLPQDPVLVWLPRPFAFERKGLASVVSKSCTQLYKVVPPRKVSCAPIRLQKRGTCKFIMNIHKTAKGRGWNYRRPWRFCCTTNRVREEPVLCVFACSIWPAALSG